MNIRKNPGSHLRGLAATHLGPDPAFRDLVSELLVFNLKRALGFEQEPLCTFYEFHRAFFGVYH